MKALALAALLALAAPFGAEADEISLSRPLAGATIHSDLVDMSVYWTPSDTAFEVVAYYVTRADVDAAPRQLRMRLESGDRVVFSLPGLTDAAYRFERQGETLTVASAPLQTDLALN